MGEPGRGLVGDGCSEGPEAQVAGPGGGSRWGLLEERRGGQSVCS